MANRASDASFYDQPQVVSDVLIAFPGELGDLLPDEKIIPEEYRGRMTGDPWVDWQAEWFFKGLKQAPIPPLERFTRRLGGVPTCQSRSSLATPVADRAPTAPHPRPTGEGAVSGQSPAG